MVTVQLPLTTLQVVHVWSSLCQQHKRFWKVPTNQIDTRQSAVGMDSIGKAGEIAAQTIYGGKIGYSLTKGGDGGTDLMGKRFTALVKTTTTQVPLSQRVLILNTLAEFIADYAILVAFQGNRSKVTDTGNVWHVIGHIDKTTFQRVHTIRDFGYGNRVVCSIADLSTPEKNLLDGSGFLLS